VLALFCVLTLSAWKCAEPVAAAPVPPPPGRKEKPAAPPTTEKPDSPLRDWVVVPAQRSGRLTLIGRELRSGEKAPEDRIVMTGDGTATRYYRLKEGDRVEKDELIGRIDDRLARTEVQIRIAKVEAAEADRVAAEKTREEAKSRYARILRIHKGGAVSEEEVTSGKLTWERFIEEERNKAASLKVAHLKVDQAKVLLQMHEIRSPIRGTIQTILLKQGEAVKEYEGVFRIKIEEK
jgi:biotin carboxyl carrier protein